MKATSWLARLHSYASPVTIFHFPRQILSGLFFTSLFFAQSEEDGSRVEGKCSLLRRSRASNGAHSASSASGVTDHAHKKCSPLKANFCERGRQLTSEKGIRDDIVRKRSCDAMGIPSEKRATFVCLVSIPLPRHLPREIESVAVNKPPLYTI